MTEKITHIVTHFCEDGLFGYDPEALERIDIAASKVAWIEAATACLQSEYPGAEVEVIEGDSNRPVNVNGDRDHPEAVSIENLLHDLWEADAWIVWWLQRSTKGA